MIANDAPNVSWIYNMIISIAGQMGSGKTTLARALARTMNANGVGFGDFVRASARTQGLDASERSILQDMGDRAVATDPIGFLNDVLLWAGHKADHDLILDGLRHVSVWHALCERQKIEPIVLVYIDVDEMERRRRLAARGLAEETISALSAHSTEQQLASSLRPFADILVDSGTPLEQSVRRIIDYVHVPASG